MDVTFLVFYSSFTIVEARKISILGDQSGILYHKMCQSVFADWSSRIPGVPESGSPNTDWFLQFSFLPRTQIYKKIVKSSPVLFEAWKWNLTLSCDKVDKSISVWWRNPDYFNGCHWKFSIFISLYFFWHFWRCNLTKKDVVFKAQAPPVWERSSLKKLKFEGKRFENNNIVGCERLVVQILWQLC